MVARDRKWLLPLSSFAALAFLVIRDTPLGIRPLFGWSLEMVTYLLSFGAFVCCMEALVRCEVIEREPVPAWSLP